MHSGNTCDPVGGLAGRPSQHRTERGPEPHTAHHLVVAVSALGLVKVRAVRTTRVPLEAPSPSRLLPLELLLRPPPTTLRRPPARETKVQAREQHVRLRLSHTAHEPLAQQPLLHRRRVFFFLSTRSVRTQHCAQEAERSTARGMRAL